MLSNMRGDWRIDLTFDFDRLQRPTSATKPLSPIEIFRASPSLPNTPNDLWQGQSKALDEWNTHRADHDVLISLHTGAGKSIVGLLIAQSLVNERVGRVLYVCATNDLVRQTAMEAQDKLALSLSTRVGGDFSNDLYSTGQGFCITNYQALFNSKSVFVRDLRPEAIIFDDAHVAEKIIRDCYTLTIAKENRAELYTRIIELGRPHFTSLGRADYYANILSGVSDYRVAEFPPSAVIALQTPLSQLFTQFGLRDRGSDESFALGHLDDHLTQCCIFASQHSIEIAPAFLPSKRISFLSDDAMRRIYLSATLTSEVDFCRAFGKRPSYKIEPESDAGIGERLIVLSDREALFDKGKKGVSDVRIASAIAAQQKLLIWTPTYATSAKYRTLAIPPQTKEFSSKLDDFRRSSGSGVFILVGRVDGIDLPHATCRAMLADGLPTGFSLYEIYLYDYLEMRRSFAAKLANRITQMFGRTNRGRNDYSVIFVTDRKFINWLSTPTNIALLPELLQKQVLLGRALMQQLKIKEVDELPTLAKQVLDRDPKWLRYYSDTIGGLKIEEDQRLRAAENDDILMSGVVAESEFAAQMWDGNPVRAREALGLVVDKVVVVDRRLAAWYNIQIGHTYELQGDTESAAKQFAQAKARALGVILALPSPSSKISTALQQEPRNQFHKKLLEIFSNDVRWQNDQIARYKRLIAPLFDSNSSSGQHEEALRVLGELLGFDATRPEQDRDEEGSLDVLWLNESEKEAILFELKTKKLALGSINKQDVGQGFNHLQWMSDAHNSVAALGLIFVGDGIACSKDASPSDAMWLSSISLIKHLYDDLVQTLEALQRTEPLERYPELSAMSSRVEWKPEGIFEKIRGRRLNETKEK